MDLIWDDNLNIAFIETNWGLPYFEWPLQENYQPVDFSAMDPELQRANDNEKAEIFKKPLPVLLNLAFRSEYSFEKTIKKKEKRPKRETNEEEEPCEKCLTVKKESSRLYYNIRPAIWRR